MYDECDEEISMIHQLLLHLTPPPRDPHSNEPQLQLYGIFNAEKYKNLWIDLECEWKLNHVSLFSDKTLEVSMNTVAPYLIHIPINNPSIITVLKHYGHEGTLFFWSKESFSKALERMRSLFEIHSDKGDKGYLAFYRPDHFIRIMNSNSSIKNTLFKRTVAWFCEDGMDSNTLYKYTMTEEHVIREKIRLKRKES